MIDTLLSLPQDKTAGKGVLKVSAMSDKPVKSIIKAVSWRVVGTIDTMVISYFITGKIAFAISIGSVEVLSKTILYYFHERLWAHIHRIKLNIFAKHHEKRYKSGIAERLSQGKINKRVIKNSGVTVPG
jgi:uncharacterized membrane protein